LLALIAGVRSPLLLSLSLLVACAVGGCGKSLTSNLSGTGGAPAAPGGAGGDGIPGTGGLGGNVVSPACEAILTEFQTAFTAAETCQVGAPGQCQRGNAGPLASCTCDYYVNDSTAIDMLETAWEAAGCDTGTPPCVLFCPTFLNNTCISTDGGTLGVCSESPGTGGSPVFGTGSAGTNGAGGTGGSSGGAGGAPGDGGVVEPGPPAAFLYPSPYSGSDYMLALSNVPISCGEGSSFPPCSPGGLTYAIWIQIPPEDLTPGVYALIGGVTSSSFAEQGPNPSGSCWGGSGGFGDGSLDVLSVSSTEFVFQLEGTLEIDSNINGITITAPRCGGTVDAGR
jgi:hypothetical protein